MRGFVSSWRRCGAAAVHDAPVAFCDFPQTELTEEPSYWSSMGRKVALRRLRRMQRREQVRLLGACSEEPCPSASVAILQRRW